MHDIWRATHDETNLKNWHDNHSSSIRSRSSGMGVTKVPSVNFSSKINLILEKVPVIFFVSHLFWQVSPQLSCGETCQI